VVVLAPNGSARRTVARGPVGGFEHTGLVEGRALNWRAGNATVHGVVWKPAGASKGLIVSVHGGPTGQALVDWNPRIQMWVQQGYTVLQPNYRGSTGYGIDYRRALEGRWGERDTADVAAGVKHGVKEGWDGGAGAILIGGSAGGLTVLNVAAEHPDLVAAVIALFPVTDLIELDATTHRFESGYNATLAGALPGARSTWVANSAITRAAKGRAPVLLLHGTNDTSVVPSQSAAMEEALRRGGTVVERHLYEGEGHGWRRAATVGDELERIESFLKRHVG
jgi:dipeptidyl aminopeptidase/acylaminoacyl peptidase